MQLVERFLSAAVVSICFGMPSLGEPIIEHMGDEDPTDRGWTLVDGEAGEPASGDVSAWQVQSGLYEASGGEPSLIAQGWKATVELQNLGINDAVDAAINLQFRTGFEIHSLWFGSDASGNLQVAKILNLAGNLSDVHTVTGENNLPGANPGYHFIEMLRNDAGPTDVYVDGVKIDVLSDQPGVVLTTAQVIRWGNGFAELPTPPPGTGNYALVKLETGPGQEPTIPEPASLVLLAVGGLLVMGPRRKQRA